MGARAADAPPGTVVKAIRDAPTLDSDGDVSWVAILNDSAGNFAQALYRQVAGSPELVFRSGDPSPGNGEPFTLFPGVPVTPRIHAGCLTFAAGIEDPVAVSRDGIWTGRFGGFDRLRLTGDHLPGTPAVDEVATFGFILRRDTLIGFASLGALTWVSAPRRCR